MGIKNKHKYMNKQMLGSGMMLFLIGTFVFGLQAQENNTGGEEQNLKVKNGQEVQCSQYYTFSELQANIQPNKTQYAPGDAVFTSGFIQNAHPYPFTDVDVTARLFRKKANSPQSEKYLLVDEWKMKEGIVLEANAKKRISGSWTLPLDANPGEYQVRLFITDHNRFSIGGRVYTDHAEIWNYDLSVEGKTAGSPYIDRTEMRINNTPYKTRGGFQRVSKNKPTDIVFPIKNPADRKDNVNISYTLYRWSDQREENQVASSSEIINLEPRQKRELAYTVPNPQESVYFLKIHVGEKDKTHSMAHIRFGTKDSNRPRVRMAGVTSMPVQGEDSVFMCMHNTNTSNVPVQADITLTDTQKDTELATTLVDGVLGGGLTGIASDINVDRAVSQATLNINLTSQGEQIDALTITYDCEQLPGVRCPLVQRSLVWYGGIALGVLLVLALAGGVWYIKKKRKS